MGSGSGQWLVVSATDTGKGIPSDELPTLFDEYRQVEGSESSVQKGTGLGLSITKKFAELLGGSIGVESEVGKANLQCGCRLSINEDTQCTFGCVI